MFQTPKAQINPYQKQDEHGIQTPIFIMTLLLCCVEATPDQNWPNQNYPESEPAESEPKFVTMRGPGFLKIGGYEYMKL